MVATFTRVTGRLNGDVYQFIKTCFHFSDLHLGSVQPGIALPATQCLFKYLKPNNSSSNQGGKIMFYSMNEQTLPCHILKFFLQKIVDRADFYISQVKFISGF